MAHETAANVVDDPCIQFLKTDNTTYTVSSGTCETPVSTATACASIVSLSLVMTSKLQLANQVYDM